MMAIFLGNAVFADCAVSPAKYPDRLALIRLPKGWLCRAGAVLWDGCHWRCKKVALFCQVCDHATGIGACQGCAGSRADAGATKRVWKK
jgi:hypothetical protein